MVAFKEVFFSVSSPVGYEPAQMQRFLVIGSCFVPKKKVLDFYMGKVSDLQFRDTDRD